MSSNAKDNIEANRGAEGVPANVPHGDEEIAIFEPLCAVFRRKLKSEGLKYTPERAQVLDTVIRLGGPFEAERVLQDVRAAGFNVSKATMYRTLKLLIEAGIVQRVLVTEEQSYFQCVYGRAANHLIIRTDVETGATVGDSSGERFEVLDLPEVRALCEKLCKERGLTMRGHQLHVFASRHNDH
ncbi:MAG: transcriptional repressor [Phycisphaerales bacterium]